MCQSLSCGRITGLGRQAEAVTGKPDQVWLVPMTLCQPYFCLEICFTRAARDCSAEKAQPKQSMSSCYKKAESVGSCHVSLN